MTINFSSRGYKKEEADEQHARELEIRKAELASEEKRTKEQEATKKLKIEAQERMQKRQMERDEKNEEVKLQQLDLELKIKLSIQKVVQERTKQLTVEAEQKRMKIEAMERTKQLSQTAAIVTKLANNETDTTTIIEFLGKMFPVTTSCTIPEEPVDGELAIAKQEWVSSEHSSS